MDIGHSLFLFKCNLAFQCFFWVVSSEILSQFGPSIWFRYTNHVSNACAPIRLSLARLCALEALMRFGVPARKHSTNIMSVMEDDVYLVRLPLESNHFWRAATWEIIYDDYGPSFESWDAVSHHWVKSAFRPFFPGGVLCFGRKKKGVGSWDCWNPAIRQPRGLWTSDRSPVLKKPRKACECIAAIGATDVMDNLPDLFNDEAPSVRQAALEALTTHPDIGKFPGKKKVLVVKCARCLRSSSLVFQICCWKCCEDEETCKFSVKRLGIALKGFEDTLQWSHC